jgi:2-polyprenyl-3-methyl-5-hydroxy-6-metoxy-1,4-benzoquinol methylase
MTLTCRYCHETATPFFRTIDYNRRLSEREFTYYRCDSCGLVFLHPIPLDLRDYYPDKYYEIPSSEDDLATLAENERYKIDIVQRYVSAGRLLEIGPAFGTFAYLAKRAGYEVEVIEMDDRCCRFMGSTLGIRVHQGERCGEFLADSIPFDVIALWHVIEHIPDPWGELEAIARSLRPGGILVIAAPNPGAFQFRIMGRVWTHVDAPRHLALIPPDLLVRKLGPIGLKPVLKTTTDPGSLGWNIFGWRFSLTNLSTHPFGKMVLGYAAIAFSILAGPVERKEGLGSAYTMVFMKVAPDDTDRNS